MLDFLFITKRLAKGGVIEVYPKFIIKKTEDLMIRGGDFYAIWDEESGLWSTSEETVVRLVDGAVDNYIAEHKAELMGSSVRPLYMWDSDSGIVDKWHRYCKMQMRDTYHSLDEKLIFANSGVNKADYASKRLQYSLEMGNIDAYDELIGTLYSEEERKKIEWAIGAIISGDSKNIQKFLVLYGSAGTGKSTILNIIQDLFQGYYCVFDAKALGNANSSFALEPFKNNPLVAIQHDGDLSRIEDNTRINSLVSHEYMTVNEKFKSAYTNRFNSFLFMGTNKPVRITDAKSGILRRLIDVTPSGEKVSQRRYKELTSQIKFELGAIAWHCLHVYQANPDAYDFYMPIGMMDSTNDFYNFIVDSSAYFTFEKEDKTTLKQAWELYLTYCDEARIQYPLNRRAFKAELQNYFREFCERGRGEDSNLRSVYYGFESDKFSYINASSDEDTKEETSWLSFDSTVSLLDKLYSDCPAQLASENGTPQEKWTNCQTTLKDIDTSKLHYVMPPDITHIVVDFDIPDENGNKSLEKNFEAARTWPKTYAELSKSGCGIHLHYIYKGNIDDVSSVFAPHIEIKVFKGNSSLRRMVTRCNSLNLAELPAGSLPTKNKRKDVMYNKEIISTDKGLHKSILKALRKEVHDSTKCNIDFINHILTEAYKSGVVYDCTDLRPAIINFAASSTHQAEYCLKLVNSMKFQSDISDGVAHDSNNTIAFFDVEVFPNLFIVCWKLPGKDKKVHRMINPTPGDIEELLKYKLIGFNNRRYDNHILYARLMGYSNEQLYTLSKRIISGSSNAFFLEAYNISYTDIYDFSSKKQSLKKFEIELGIHHHELGMRWDQPVPEDKWELVASYCDDDVLATEAVFEDRQDDFIARQILAAITGGTVNDTTNSLSTKFIFGNNRHPQDQFNYRNLADPCKDKPYFKGYKFESGKSYYKGYEVGEGGFVWAKPGMYWNVWVFDVASMHPSSIIAEQLFGTEYTKRFEELKLARLAIKHDDEKAAKTLLGGALKPFIESGEFDVGKLSKALKIVINAVYGLTAAKFDNPFRDPRNIDNIVAKRGALFMIDLKEAVEAAGGEVIHIKTDSIKVVNPSEEIKELIISMGKKYGYDFEIEHIFERICLVNDAVYVGKVTEDDEEWLGKCKKAKKEAEEGGYEYVEPTRWTATGAQFAVPYVFKTLFSHKEIEFKDVCETKSVSSALYLDMNESGEHDYRFVGKVGLFCPMKPGCGAGELMRQSEDKEGNVKYGAVSGTKGYRWLESEVVVGNHLEDQIDDSYYIHLVDVARETISKYGDFEAFVA